jgi:propanol-preferring alcohol dehydrogenase
MVLTEYDRPLEYQDVDDPRPGNNEIVMKVRAAGMCSTDIKIITGMLSDFIKLPHIPGHEIAGDIVGKGKDVKHLEIGQSGVAYPVIGCGRCCYCITGNENLCANTRRLGFEENGGFAEYVKMPADNFCRISPGLPFEDMSILSDALGTPYHAFTKIARPMPGKPVLIIGSGGLGLHAVQIAKLMGCFVIACDIREDSLSAAKQGGADVCVNIRNSADPPGEILQLTDGLGVDVVLEGVGKQDTVSLGLKCLKKQGTLIVMGYNPRLDIIIPFIDLHNKELKVAGTKICTRQDLVDVIGLVEKGLIKPVISETMLLAGLNTALEAVKDQKTVGRICIRN